MIRRFRLFPYLLTVILLCSVAVFGSIILYDFTFCRDMLIRSQEDKYTTLLSISADQISYQLQIVEEALAKTLISLLWPLLPTIRPQSNEWN